MKRTGALLTLLILFWIPGKSVAQDPTPLCVSIGALKTELERSALKFALKYVEDFSTYTQNNQEKSLIYYTPDINIETGSEDSFSSIVAKMSAVYLYFGTTTIAGYETPKTEDLVHVVPISLGFESNRGFTNVAGLVEMGYIPWYQNQALKSESRFVRELARTSVGVFAQGGYKFDAQSADSIGAEGGEVDQSEENADDGILRLKLSAKYGRTLLLDPKQGFGIGVVAAGDGWCDIWNAEVYHRVQASFRIMLSKTRSFDLVYENGSGTPNFNKGKQFSANITVLY